jgi:hypothetical protein
VTGAASAAGPAIKPAYLIAGTDAGKIDLPPLLRARQHGAGQALRPSSTDGPPAPRTSSEPFLDVSMSARRHLLADGIDRWTVKQAASVIGRWAACRPT